MNGIAESAVPRTISQYVKNAILMMSRVLYFVIMYAWILIILPTIGTAYSSITRICGLSDANSHDLYDVFASHSMYYFFGIKHSIERDAEPIENGFCLSNHRSFFDCILDAYVMKSSIIIRGMSIMVVPFLVLFTYATNVMLMINRGVDHRDAVYAKCADFLASSTELPSHRYRRRITFYPEGTRMSYTELKSEDDLRSKLKFGLLRSIYEAKQYPVQISISSNKDAVISEKWLSAQYGVTVRSVISKPIHPKDYTTIEAFFDEIIQTWYRCYHRTHDTTVVADSSDRLSI